MNVMPMTQDQSLDAINAYMTENPDDVLGVRVQWRLGESPAHVATPFFNGLGVTPQMLIQPELWLQALAKNLRGIFELQAFGRDGRPVGGIFKFKKEGGSTTGEADVSAMFGRDWMGPPVQHVKLPIIERDRVTGQPIPPKDATRTELLVPPASARGSESSHAGALADPAAIQAYNRALAENDQLRQSQASIMRDYERLKEEGIRRDAETQKAKEVEQIRREADQRQRAQDQQLAELRQELTAMRARPAEPPATKANPQDIIAAVVAGISGIAGVLAPTLIDLRKDSADRDRRASEADRLAREDAQRRADDAQKRADAAAAENRALMLEMIKKPADSGQAFGKMFETSVAVSNKVMESMIQMLELRSQYEGGDEDPPWMRVADRAVGAIEKIVLFNQVKSKEEQAKMMRIQAVKLAQDQREQAAKAAAERARVQQVPIEVAGPPRAVPPPRAAPGPQAPQPKPQAATPPPPPAMKIVDALVTAAKSHLAPDLVAAAVCEALRGTEPQHLEFQQELAEVYKDQPDVMFTDKLGSDWLLDPQNAGYAMALAKTIEDAIKNDPSLEITDDDEDGEDGIEDAEVLEAAPEVTEPPPAAPVAQLQLAPVPPEPTTVDFPVNGARSEPAKAPKRQRAKAKPAEEKS